ncbi:MAG TPA: hypothetical protein PKC67_05310 [Kiritimatiellia bacterium]|nr:hypothetical protein [Kiritimatiellia bacterium]HMP33751.1 hypothetical protein [Kiritimatiellia bacterium]
MRIQGTIGHLKKFVDEFNRPARPGTRPAHAGSDHPRNDSHVQTAARDAFYLREQHLRVQRLKRGMRRFYLAVAIILIVWLLWLSQLFFI